MGLPMKKLKLLKNKIIIMNNSLESLNKFEKELLKAEQGKGISKLNSDRTGSFIKAGGRSFYFKDDLNITKKYVDALESLCDNGYVRQRKPGSHTYILTEAGKMIAEKIK